VLEIVDVTLSVTETLCDYTGDIEATTGDRLSSKLGRFLIKRATGLVAILSFRSGASGLLKFNMCISLLVRFRSSIFSAVKLFGVIGDFAAFD